MKIAYAWEDLHMSMLCAEPKQDLLMILGKKGKVFTKGSSLELLTLLTIIFRGVSEKIAEDNKMELNKAMDIVLESIKNGSEKLS